MSSFSIFATGMPRPLSIDRDGVVRVDRHRDRVAVAGERLVHRVVHNLVDEVVQPAHTGRADVHAGTLADGLEALENRDVLGVVARWLLLSVGWVAGAQGSLSSTQATPRRDDQSSEAGAWQISALNISSRGFVIRTRARSKSPANVKDQVRVARVRKTLARLAAQRRVEARRRRARTSGRARARATALSHATVSTPSRSATGSEVRANDPGGRRPRPLDAPPAASAARAGRRARRARTTTGRGPLRLTRCPRRALGESSDARPRRVVALRSPPI